MLDRFCCARSAEISAQYLVLAGLITDGQFEALIIPRHPSRYFGRSTILIGTGHRPARVWHALGGLAQLGTLAPHIAAIEYPGGRVTVVVTDDFGAERWSPLLPVGCTGPSGQRTNVTRPVEYIPAVGNHPTAQRAAKLYRRWKRLLPPVQGRVVH